MDRINVGGLGGVTNESQNYYESGHLVASTLKTDHSMDEDEKDRQRKEMIANQRGQNRQFGQELAKQAGRKLSDETADKQEDELEGPKNPPGVGENYDGWA